MDPSGHFFWFLVPIILGAVLGGVSAGIGGGSIGMGILMGTLGGAMVAGGALGATALWGPAWAFVGAAVGGAASGAANAAVSGGNIGTGALTGAIGAGVGCGVGYGVGQAFGQFWGAVAGGLAGGVAGGGAGAGLGGGNFWQGAGTGAAYGVAGAAAGYAAVRVIGLQTPAGQKGRGSAKSSLNVNKGEAVSAGQALSRKGGIRIDFVDANGNVIDADPSPGLPSSRTTTVIGAWQDTQVAADWPDHNVLNLPRNEYTWQKNVDWLNTAIRRGDAIYLATDPKTCTGTYGQTFLREIEYLQSQGYVQNGQHMVPNECAPR